MKCEYCGDDFEMRLCPSCRDIPKLLMMKHGSTCPKEKHKKGQAYMHEEDDDTAYLVDGVFYCGRCHTCI